MLSRCTAVGNRCMYHSLAHKGIQVSFIHVTRRRHQLRHTLVHPRGQRCASKHNSGNSSTKGPPESQQECTEHDSLRVPSSWDQEASASDPEASLQQQQEQPQKPHAQAQDAALASSAGADQEHQGQLLQQQGSQQEPQQEGQQEATEQDHQQQQHPVQQQEQQQQQQQIPAGQELPYIPWGMGKVVQVMVLWLLAYVLLGQVLMPVVLALLGIDRDALGSRGHALLHLALDVGQLAATCSILAGCLKKYKPLARGIFPVRLQGWWPLAVLLCCTSFPFIDWLAHQSVLWFPVEGDMWSAQLEQSLAVGDWVANAAYFMVVSVCAPVWEEAIFRGFLLSSLRKVLPLAGAVLLSSLLFALCHFRLQTFAPLLLLGLIFSLLFHKTNNLLPPIVLHSLWNFYVLFQLLARPA